MDNDGQTHGNEHRSPAPRRPQRSSTDSARHVGGLLRDDIVVSPASGFPAGPHQMQISRAQRRHTIPCAVGVREPATLPTLTRAAPPRPPRALPAKLRLGEHPHGSGVALRPHGGRAGAVPDASKKILRGSGGSGGSSPDPEATRTRRTARKSPKHLAPGAFSSGAPAASIYSTHQSIGPASGATRCGLHESTHGPREDTSLREWAKARST